MTKDKENKNHGKSSKKGETISHGSGSISTQRWTEKLTGSDRILKKAQVLPDIFFRGKLRSKDETDGGSP